MEKREFRQLVRERFKALSSEQRKHKSADVVGQLSEIIAQREPSVVALFAPMADEVQIGELIEQLASGGRCKVVLPRVLSLGASAEMEFYPYKAGEMASGAFGILEPQGVEPCNVADIDLMIVPGVAFTRRGVRLGRGKGYYDRYIARDGFRAECIGACYDFQLFDELPAEPHDSVMDMVVCDNSKFKIQNSKL